MNSKYLILKVLCDLTPFIIGDGFSGGHGGGGEGAGVMQHRDVKP